jgi:hypothetical protein
MTTEERVRKFGEFLGWVGDLRYYLHRRRLYVMPFGGEMRRSGGRVETIRRSLLASSALDTIRLLDKA